MRNLKYETLEAVIKCDGVKVKVKFRKNGEMEVSGEPYIPAEAIRFIGELSSLPDRRW